MHLPTWVLCNSNIIRGLSLVTNRQKKKNNNNNKKKALTLDGLHYSRMQVLIFWRHGSHQPHKHDHAHKVQE